MTRIVSALVALLFASVPVPVFAQAHPGGQFDRAALGLTTSLYNGIHPDFDFDGNRNTIELIEERQIPNGGGAVELRVGRVTSVSPVRLCLGPWFTPTTVVWEHLGSDPLIWFNTRIANLGGRHVLWYWTATTFGWLDFALPACG